ncbi:MULTISPECIES: IS1595 family transposase [Acidobacteriaceae]|uniref:IS1595 family transposase n=1 Tax=Acidobacteriaceae TaxID=204434 RepID=UPI00131CED0B|nr:MULTISPECIES: IS1595 family transposase [Acidobacteriaceae]MDW5267333.1 IS1595 family transposase [Edaphobacter sp.]
MEVPKTLLEAIQYFSDAENCRQFMIAVRWSDGIVKCPHCGSEKVTYLEKAKVYQCYGKHAKSKFSLKVGTVFEDSPIGLEKWLPASWLLSNSKNGISSYELSKSIGVTQKSAWFMLHRIRTAMKEDHGNMTMGGNWSNPVEVDETFIGGKAVNKHLGNRKQVDRKTIVMGMLNRQTRQIRAKVIPNVKRETLQAEILEHVGFNAYVFTDGHVGYDKLSEYKNFTHKTVNHINEYVNGRVHTQGIENFWSLLKRGLNGTYVAVEPFHMDSYVDEQVFRYNTRKQSDGQRFKKVVSQLAGKRLTYAELTGKEEGATC